MVTIRKSTGIATLLVSLTLIPLLSNSAEAGWRHHFRHRHHHGIRVGWGGYGWGGYGWGGGWHRSGWGGGWHHGWRYVAPVRYLTPVYRYHYDPIGCYGLGGYGGYGYGGYGWGGYGWLSSNDARVPAAPLETPRVLAGPEDTRPLIAQRPNSTSEIVLKVEVPDDACVYINDLETTAEGSQRSYVAKRAKSNEGYNFVVRAEVVRDNRLVTETKIVQLNGGQNSSLSFDLNAAPQAQVVTTQAPVDTTLKVRVPDGAKVYLAGNETRQTGEERVYITKRLQAGETWEDYKIRVTWNEAGQEQTREEKITLVAGETRELEFANEPRLAKLP